MPFLSELSSVETVPQPGDVAPTPRGPLRLEPGKRSIIVFLRHCGCPFAEKTFVRMREVARRHPDIDFTAVSHSNKEATENWHKSVPDYGSEPANLSLLVDDEKKAYWAYGLGASSFGHVLGYSSLSSVFAVKKEGFDVRPTESGSRWQTGGWYAVGGDGKIKLGGPSKSAEEIPDFEEIVKQLGG